MPIDEVSEALGSFKSDITNLKERDTIAQDKLDKILDKLTLMNGSISKAHGRIDNVEDEMITKKGAMKAIIGGGLFAGAGINGVIEALRTYFSS